MFVGEWTTSLLHFDFPLQRLQIAARLVCKLLFFSFLTNNQALQRFSSVTLCHSYPYLIYVITVTPP